MVNLNSILNSTILYTYLPTHLPTYLPNAHICSMSFAAHTHTRRHIITSHQIDDRAKISLNQLNPCKNSRKREIPAEKKQTTFFGWENSLKNRKITILNFSNLFNHNKIDNAFIIYCILLCVERVCINDVHKCDHSVL